MSAPASGGMRNTVNNMVSAVRGALPGPISGAFDLPTHDPVRSIGLLFAIGFLFARFSFVSEGVMEILHVPLYMNYWTAPMALIALLLSGGLGRALTYRGAIFMVLFAFWMALTIPTSSWPGGSMSRVQSYLQFEFPVLVLIGGLAFSWDDVIRIFKALAWSGIAVLVFTRLLGHVEQGRLSLDFSGTIANSNDLSSHLLLLLPFLLFMVMNSKVLFPLRIIFLGAIGYSLYAILGTASRGALVALAAGMIFVLLSATMGQRLMLLTLIPVFLIGAAVLQPERTLGRLSALTGGSDAEAEESGDSRRYLFEQSLLFTLKHPILGVGADQFANYEGKTRLQEGQRGNWHATHCSWTQISSECGLPALLFYTGAIGWTFLRMRKAYRACRQYQWTEGTNACFCFLLSMVFFFVSITFLSQAYTFRQLMIVAVGFVMSSAVERVVQRYAEAQKLATTGGTGGTGAAQNFAPAMA